MEALMAAALKNHPNIIMTDCNANTLNNAELEVKKLQALIRKLEKQNEQLRSRASPHRLSPSPPCIGGGGGGCCLPTPLPALLCQSSSLGSYCLHSDGSDEEEEEEDDGEPTVLDEVDLLDLDSLFPSDEEDAETWLYVSSKARMSCVDSPLTPVQWCRMVLDRPKSEVEVVRRSLSLKLDQVSRWRSMFSSPPAAPPFNRVAGVPPLSSSPLARACSTPQLSERHAPPLSSPVHPILQRAVSPMGKETAALSDRTPTFFPHLGNRNRSLQRSASSPQSSMDSELMASMMEDDSLVLQGYKLNDLTDVQVMARLQEESLRQDYASSSTSSSALLPPRRSHSLSLHLSGLSAAVSGLDEEDEEEEEEDYALLPPPQPRLTRLSHSHTFSSIRDWRRSTSSLVTPPSTPSTPPCPSAGLAFQHHHALGLGMGLGMASSYAADLQQSFRPGSDKLRRSMPNLVKAPSMTCVPSIPANHIISSPLLRNSQSFDSSSGLARLQSSIPSPGQLQNRVQSVGNFVPLSRQPLKATAYVSPTIKGSASMSTATSLQSLNNSSCGGVGAGSGTGGVGGVSSGIPMLSKVAGGGGGTPTSSPAPPPRSSLPRPASFIGPTSSTPRSKINQPARSLLTPPKSLSTFSALRDTSWKDGCY